MSEELTTVDTQAIDTVVLPSEDTPVLYDKSVEQSVTLLAAHDTEKGKKRFKIVHTIKPLDDESMIAFLENLDVLIENNRAGQSVTVDGWSARVKLYDRLARHIEGYKLNGTADWKRAIEESEKVEVVNQLTMCDVIRVTADDYAEDADEGELAPLPTIGGFSEMGTREYSLRARFSGRELALTHVMIDPTAHQRKAWEMLSSTTNVKPGSTLGRTMQKIPNSTPQKYALYRSLCKETAGYAGQPPVHHCIKVIDQHMSEVAKDLQGN